jgi:hypothetical protein
LVRLFPINSLGFSKFLENGRNSNYLLETHFAVLLESQLQNRSFHQPVPNLKQNEKNKKAFESSEMGIWRGMERGVAGFKVKNTRS